MGLTVVIFVAIIAWRMAGSMNSDALSMAVGDAVWHLGWHTYSAIGSAPAATNRDNSAQMMQSESTGSGCCWTVIVWCLANGYWLGD